VNNICPGDVPGGRRSDDAAADQPDGRGDEQQRQREQPGLRVGLVEAPVQIAGQVTISLSK